MNNLLKSTVEKLMAYRDATEAEKGPNANMDHLVEKNLIKLLMDSNRVADVPTMRWCHRQLERERGKKSPRLLKAESLVPSGILDAVDDFYDPSPSPMRRPSANPALALSALDVYDWNPSPHMHPYSHNFPEAPARAFVNPFSNSASALQEFVLPPAAINPDANVRCNRCNQMGHRRAACPNPSVPGHRGGKTRTNKHKKGKKSKKSKKH